MEKTNNMTPAEKRQMVLESIDFFTKQRNIALFKIHAAKKETKVAAQNLKDAKNKASFFKDRIVGEVLNNQTVLTEEDKKRFIARQEESDEDKEI